MQEVDITFTRDSETRLRKGKKRATTRKEKEADEGDVFVLEASNGHRMFEITHVVKAPLQTAMTAFYKQEGYSSIEEFHEELYSIYGGELTELIDGCYVHLFTEVTGQRKIVFLDEQDIIG